MSEFNEAFAVHELAIQNLSNYNGIDKMKIIRNCVEPEMALHIFEMAFKKKQEVLNLGEQTE